VASASASPTEVTKNVTLRIDGQEVSVADGTTILDISDPRQPRVVSKLMTSHPWSHSHKVRVVGDLMVVNSEIEPGKGDGCEGEQLMLEGEQIWIGLRRA